MRPGHNSVCNFVGTHDSQVEEQKRRAEADKLAALTALENASAEFMREKQEKKELEAKIAAMQVRFRPAS